MSYLLLKHFILFLYMPHIISYSLQVTIEIRKPLQWFIPTHVRCQFIIAVLTHFKCHQSLLVLELVFIMYRIHKSIFLMECGKKVGLNSDNILEGLESLRCPHSRIFRFRNQECHTHIPSPMSVVAIGSICISSTCSKDLLEMSQSKSQMFQQQSSFNWSEPLSHRSVYFLLSWLLFWIPQSCLLMYLMTFAELSLKVRLVIPHNL